MPHFLIRWKYTGQAAKHIIDNPANRGNLMRVMVEDFGGELLAYYWTFGEYDGFFVTAFPNSEAALAYAKTAEATEGFSRYVIEPAFTSEEALSVLQTAHNTQTAYFLYRASLRPPGGTQNESN